MTTPATEKVFISYSHDRKAWADRKADPDTQRKRVRDLANRFRNDGVECAIDQYFEDVPPVEGWPRWMQNQIDEADFVLVVATETYNLRFRGKADPGEGKGADWEGITITQNLYDAQSKSLKFIPILFDHSDESHIPQPLKSTTYYDVSSDAGYDALYYRITDQLGEAPPPVGTKRTRPASAPSSSTNP